MAPISSSVLLLLCGPAITRAARVATVAGISDVVQENDAATSEVETQASSGVAVAGQVLRERYVLKQFLRRKESSYQQQVGKVDDNVTRVVSGGPGGTPGEQFPYIDRGHLTGHPKHLGTGSFGDVWEAYDQDTKQNVAVKIFYTKQGGQPKFMTWLNAAPHERQELETSEKECGLVQQILSHKHMDPVGASHICACFGEHISDAQRTDNAVFLVLEMCGAELTDQITDLKEKGSTNVASARTLTKQMLEALNFMVNFNPPLIHHDLKPANVAVTKDGHVKLIDWGGLVFGAPQNMFAPAVGTPLYTPPEADNGRCGFQLPAHSYDVYAVGLMYMELLCPSMDYNEWFYYRPLNTQTVQMLMAKRCRSLDQSQIRSDLALMGQMIDARPTSRPSPSQCLGTAPLSALGVHTPGGDAGVPAAHIDEKYQVPVHGNRAGGGGGLNGNRVMQPHTPGHGEHTANDAIPESQELTITPPGLVMSDMGRLVVTTSVTGYYADGVEWAFEKCMLKCGDTEGEMAMTPRFMNSRNIQGQVNIGSLRTCGVYCLATKRSNGQAVRVRSPYVAFSF